MERYDPGLKTVASAQKARDAGNCKQAHSLFVQGIEELLGLVQTETNESIRTLVRKHVAKFMAEAESLALQSAKQVADKQNTSLRKAQKLEKTAWDLEKSLAFQKAHKAFVEAAEAYQVNETQARCPRSHRLAMCLV
jgi:hypothetical protein